MNIPEPDGMNSEAMGLLVNTLMERMIRDCIHFHRKDVVDAVDHLDRIEETAKKLEGYTGIPSETITDLVEQLVDKGIAQLEENGEDIKIMPFVLIVVRVIEISQEQYDYIRAHLNYAAQQKAAEKLGGEVTGESSGKVDPDVFENIFKGLPTTNN